MKGVYKELIRAYYKIDFKKVKELWKTYRAIKLFYNFI